MFSSPRDDRMGLLWCAPSAKHSRDKWHRRNDRLAIGMPRAPLNSKKEDTPMQKWTRMFLAAVLGVAIVAGTAKPSFAREVETKGKVQMGGAKSPYDRLRGKKAIAAVVDEFVANVATDAMINKLFAGRAGTVGRQTIRLNVRIPRTLCTKCWAQEVPRGAPLPEEKE
jgi:hypothetical protein